MKSPFNRQPAVAQGFPMAFIMEQAGGSASCGMFKGTLALGLRRGLYGQGVPQIIIDSIWKIDDNGKIIDDHGIMMEHI